MMAFPKILIVDDEPNVRFILGKILKNEGYQIDMASNGAEALQKLLDSSYDLMLLDLHMEGLDGVQVLESVRKFDEDVVIIILTAQGSMRSAIEGLRQGAFDYLFKPVIPEIIRERVRDGLEYRRKLLNGRQGIVQAKSAQEIPDEVDILEEDVAVNGKPNGRFLQSGKLFIDYHHREVMYNERLLELTTTEFDLLAYLVKLEPEAVSAQDLVKSVMGYDVQANDARNTIKYHIHNLRQKIEQNPSKPKHLKTIRYKGYLWVSE